MSENSEQVAIQKRALGWGLACEPCDEAYGRDLVLAPRDGAGGALDFRRVEGLENLGQDLSVALTTALGSDPFNLESGFDGISALVEETDPVLQRERIRVSLVRVVKRDPRVSRIVDVQLEDARLSTASVRSMRWMNVRVVFETVTNQRSVLNLKDRVSDDE